MKPDLFTYLDYRSYLRDLYLYAKQNKKSFSYRSLSRRGGFQSPNFIQLVLAGKRNLSQDSISKMAAAFQLNRNETSFFEILVHFTQSKTSEEKAKYFRRMSKSSGFRKIRELEKDQFDYFAHWYYPAIRELTSLDSFKNDPIWIAEQFRQTLTIRQVCTALETLERLGLIEKAKNGRLSSRDKTVTSGDEPTSVAIRSFHQEMGRVAIESIDTVPAKERDISGVMVSIPADQVPLVKERISAFRKELLHEIDHLPGKRDCLYQMNIQLFPLTKRGRKK